MKPARKLRTPTPQVCTEEQSSSTLDTAGRVQARTIKGVFMFRSVAQKAKKTKSSLGLLQELPSNQKPLGNQAEATKKPGRWSTFGKFKVDINMTQKISATGGATRKQGKLPQDKNMDYRPIRDAQQRTQNGGE